MKDFKVKVRYVFVGWYDVSAENEQQARRIAKEDCGFVIGGDIHTSNSMHVKDWEFDVHPEKWIGSTRQVKQPKGRAGGRGKTSGSDFL